MGYAAEYLTRGTFAAIPMGSFPLMSIKCILYHFWGVHRILLPPPRQFCRDPASSYQPTSQSPSFHQPRHTINFSILSILLILSKTSTHSTQSTRLSSSLFVYFVYFVVQISASFAFFAAEGFTLLNQSYSSSDSSRRASFRAGFLRVSSTAYTFTKPSDSL